MDLQERKELNCSKIKAIVLDETDQMLNFGFQEDIEKILKKGKISNPVEYELLLNRVDEICLDNSKSNEVIEINKILVNYHTR